MSYFREDYIVPFDSYSRDSRLEDEPIHVSEYARLRRLQEKDDWYSIHDER